MLQCGNRPARGASAGALMHVLLSQSNAPIVPTSEARAPTTRIVHWFFAWCACTMQVRNDALVCDHSAALHGQEHVRMYVHDIVA
jgi:hypothetical protein